jgi:peptidoglycan-N-acetylglucosamine deacetylase
VSGVLRLALLLAFAAALLGAAACGDGDAEPTPTPTPTDVVPTIPADTPTVIPTPAPTPTPEPEPTVVPPPPATPVTEARVVYRGNPARRTVALTFDAGADTGFTADILATLRRERVRASFGLTGAWAARNPDLVRAMAADGHTFINHSYDHPSFTGFSTGMRPLTRDERLLQLSRTETTVRRLTFRSTLPYFRPPYGDLDPSVLRDVGSAGYDTVVMWTVDTFGWRGASANEIIRRSLDLAEPGAIYVLHVGAESQDGPALQGIIDGLRAEGYSFGTIDEVLAE